MCRIGQNLIYTVHIWCYWQGKRKIYGHMSYTVYMYGSEQQQNMNLLYMYGSEQQQTMNLLFSYEQASSRTL